jgi:hypothetical protein
MPRISLPARNHVASFVVIAVMELSKAEHSAPEWQAAMEAFILVAESGGATMLARIGVMRALNRYHVREFTETGKKHHRGRRELKRDQ